MALKPSDPTMKDLREWIHILDSVYSNSNHELDEQVMDQLRHEPGTCASHTAWDFCGWVWYQDGRWHEQVHQYLEVVDERSAENLRELIDGVNAHFGHR